MAGASQAYELALDHFPDLDNLELEGWSAQSRPTRYRVQYWHAELLWSRGLWADCGPAFDRVVELDPSGEYLHDAAYGAVLCYDNLWRERHGQDEERQEVARGDRRRSGQQPICDETTSRGSFWRSCWNCTA